MTKSHRLLAVLATGVLTLVAGCGSGETPQVATAGGATSSASASGPSDVVAAYVDSVREFVACVRAKGVKVTDPDARGRFTYEGDPRTLKADPNFRAAQQACAAKLPPVPQELEDPLPPLSAEEIEKAREYAKCMRENGAPDFPDPGPDGYFTDDDGRPTWDQDSAGARRATDTCERMMGHDPDKAKG